MFVRGRASLNDSSPLVLIDGVERPMAQIDPDDIETISVLKDASATAVYGVRGANGVILVTTRRGREGETRISFSSEFGVTSFNRISQTLSAESVSRFMREGAINDGFDPSDTVILAGFSCQNMTTISIVPRKARLHTRTMTL